jgi:hypothetical protein
MQYQSFILSTDVEIVRDVQEACAELAEREAQTGERWNTTDAANIAHMLNASPRPRSLFRFIDEKTGSPEVGYRTRDGREWFHILRQMRNMRGSGLLENLCSDDSA